MRNKLTIFCADPGTFDNIMLSNSFNLIDHSCVSLLLECQQQGIKITNVGIFASGLLCVAPAACASS